MEAASWRTWFCVCSLLTAFWLIRVFHASCHWVINAFFQKFSTGTGILE